MTYQEQLEQVRQAITDVLTKGQAFVHDTGSGRRQVTRADLEALERREKRLITLAARESKGGGIRVRYGVPR